MTAGCMNYYASSAAQDPESSLSACGRACCVCRHLSATASELPLWMMTADADADADAPRSGENWPIPTIPTSNCLMKQSMFFFSLRVRNSEDCQLNVILLYGVQN